MQTVFERYEIKYMLNKTQKQALLQLLDRWMLPDRYGHSSIRNIYYDTKDYRLIRRSLEKPLYKEKLRVRSYGLAAKGDRVFVEIKKKYRSVVYKRRLPTLSGVAEDYLANVASGKTAALLPGQIGQEIDHFCRFYAPLCPAMYLAYERDSFADKYGGDLRLTLDEHIVARAEKLTLNTLPDGLALLPEGACLLEVKTSGGLPRWFLDFLNTEKLFRRSFSKYGQAYQSIILNRKGELSYVDGTVSGRV